MHELGHVVQQSQGPVQATTQVMGVPVNDEERLEREADEIRNVEVPVSEPIYSSRPRLRQAFQNTASNSLYTVQLRAATEGEVPRLRAA